jgi:hypothetical protein
MGEVAPRMGMYLPSVALGHLISMNWILESFYLGHGCPIQTVPVVCHFMASPLDFPQPGERPLGGRGLRFILPGTSGACHRDATACGGRSAEPAPGDNLRP